jgi:Protein of unknown function (DUF642)/PEP-CTERM motif
MRKILLTALLAAPVASFAATNLLIDGSFESASVASGSYVIFTSTSNPGVPGWTAMNEIEVRNDDVGTAENGSKFVELDANSNSSMSQSFATVAGATYDLSFYYSNRADTAASTNGLSFSVGNLSNVVTALPGTNYSSNNEWQLYTGTFKATTNLTTLTFHALGTSDSYGTSLDNVAVTAAVPEPGTYAMMFAGLVSIGFFVRRRRG